MYVHLLVRVFFIWCPPTEDRADKLARVQAEDQAKERSPDDEETEDEDVFKEQQLLRQAQAKRDARVVDRLARLKIDRYKLVGEDKLLVKQCIFKSAKSKQSGVASIYDSNHS